ncbi:hypothetical protein ACFONG_13855 [Uliginosibacterium paludis]|uniref:Uncharacterized protein n=1 Tax=Uliginosibacterium paludis TaxID=1615952 RepID=A0ABV2CPX6_9RHOO
MDLDIGARKPVDGGQVFLVGRCAVSAEPPFVLLHDAGKQRRYKRNIKGRPVPEIVAALGKHLFSEVPYPGWGTVWFRVDRVRAVRELDAAELAHSSSGFGSLVLFVHDPEPADEHAGFMLLGIERRQALKLIGLDEGSHPDVTA